MAAHPGVCVCRGCMRGEGSIVSISVGNGNNVVSRSSENLFRRCVSSYGHGVNNIMRVQTCPRRT